MRHLTGALFALALATPALAVDCSEDSVTLQGDWGTARFSVEIADDDAERARGLMFRESMPRMSGMLFLYDQPQQVAFWMKNTLIPLDLLFADARGVIGHIHHEAIPHDETAIPGRGPRLAILEINGGMARALGIDVGTVMCHPAFGSAAACSCDGS